MDSVTLQQQLQQLTGQANGIKRLGRQHSALLFPVNPDKELVVPEQPVLHEDSLWLPLYEEDGRVTALWIETAGLTELELRLTHFAATSLVEEYRKQGMRPEGEADSRQVSAWLNAQLDSGRPDAELPDDMPLKARMLDERIPFLLLCEQAHGSDLSYRSLHKLVRSYFDSETLLIPLQDNEWLILADKALLTGDYQEEDGENEHDPLEQACMGLHELIASEWVGVFHLAVASAVSPAKGLPGVVAMLRETVALGRIYQVGEYIHLPWELHLERLVGSIPEDRRRLLLDQIGDFTGVLADKEMLLTLETFFEMDCNVSETAKKLYIHRNTLLYRLDKIKQETGADVRSFSDAAIVKLTMLLYKVTKRK